jgi:hypothetical protein
MLILCPQGLCFALLRPLFALPNVSNNAPLLLLLENSTTYAFCIKMLRWFPFLIAVRKESVPPAISSCAK